MKHLGLLRVVGIILLISFLLPLSTVLAFEGNHPSPTPIPEEAEFQSLLACQPGQRLQSRFREEITGQDRNRLLNKILNTSDVQNVLGALGYKRQVPLSNAKAIRHILHESRSLLMVAVPLDMQYILVYYEMGDVSKNGFTLQESGAMILRVQRKTVQAEIISVNGELLKRQYEGGFVQLKSNSCGGCGTTGYYRARVCYSWNIGCLIACCGGCAVSCGNPISCVVCVVLQCGAGCLWGYGCCTRSGYECLRCPYR